MPDPQSSERQDQHSAALEVRRFAGANLSAVVATGIEWVLVVVLVHFSVHYLVAAGIGAGLGAITDFSIKRYWAFARHETDSAVREGVRYVVASGASLGLNILASFLLVSRLHLPKVPGVITASLIIGLLWNYPVHRFFVFPDRSTNPASA